MTDDNAATTRESDRPDVVIVGCGLVGAWAARELAGAGLKVLVLDAGPMPVPSTSRTNQWTRERRVAAAGRQAIQARHPAYWWHDPSLFVDDVDNPYTSTEARPFTWIRGRQIGGRSLTWGGVTLRFSDREFLGCHPDGAGATWPLSYSELAPFYDRIERFWGVCGSADGLPGLPDGIFGAPAPMTDSEQDFKRAVEARWSNCKVIHCRGIPEPDETDNSSAGSWPVRTILHRMLPDALRTGRVQVRENCIVSHVVPADSGTRVAGVACIDRETRETFRVDARVVALCASAYESVRVLLNSASSCYPNGVGNSSGLLGRYLLDHAIISIGGVVPASNTADTVPLGGPHGILVPRFRNVDGQDCDFSGGYGVWGFFQRGNLLHTNHRLWTLTAMMEVSPNFHNRLQIDDDVRDAWGIGVPRVTLAYGTNELTMQNDAEQWMRAAVGAMGLNVGWRTTTNPGGFVHELGGARVGTSATNSVLNRYNQSWDTPNLFVLDGAAFATAGWQNPTLTMMALAARACEHMVSELSAGAL